MNTMTMRYDRDYWRCCPTRRLIEEARESADELTIAMGERLDAYETGEDPSALQDELVEVRRSMEYFRKESFSQQDEIRRLRTQVAQLTDEGAKAEALLRGFCLLASAHSEHVGHIFARTLPEAQGWLIKYEEGHSDAPDHA